MHHIGTERCRQWNTYAIRHKVCGYFYRQSNLAGWGIHHAERSHGFRSDIRHPRWGAANIRRSPAAAMSATKNNSVTSTVPWIMF
jgi:hypothetical protein